MGVTDRKLDQQALMAEFLKLRNIIENQVGAKKYTISEAKTNASEKEGVDSITTLLSSRGGLVAVFQNLGTIASPDVRLIGRLNLQEASYGGCGISIVNEGNSVSSFVEGVGLVVSGASTLSDYSYIDDVYLKWVMHPTNIFTLMSDVAELEDGTYVLAGIKSSSGTFLAGEIRSTTNYKGRLQDTSAYTAASVAHTSNRNNELKLGTSHAIGSGASGYIFGQSGYNYNSNVYAVLIRNIESLKNIALYPAFAASNAAGVIVTSWGF